MGPAEFFGLEGRTALVTGGGTGLGASIAAALSAAGAGVVVCSRKVEACEAVAERLRRDGREALALRCDVTDADEVDAAVARAVAEFGRVDILVNNSGVAWGAPAEDTPIDKFEEQLRVNVLGTFTVSRAVGRHMISRASPGSIINIASVAAFKGAQPGYIEAVGYNASKGGVVSLTRALAGSWARCGIRVNAIAPGWFPTKMSAPLLEQRGEEFLKQIPMGRFGKAEDIGGVAVFLAAPASAYITGQTIIVDGGQELW